MSTSISDLPLPEPQPQSQPQPQLQPSFPPLYQSEPTPNIKTTFGESNNFQDVMHLVKDKNTILIFALIFLATHRQTDEVLKNILGVFKFQMPFGLMSNVLKAVALIIIYIIFNIYILPKL